MPKDVRVELVAYEDFPLDWKTLPSAAQESVGLLFEKLQQNPYDPAIVNACELGPDERFAYTIPQGYLVFWRIVHKGGVLDLSPWDNITVQVTGIGSTATRSEFVGRPAALGPDQ